MALYHNDRKAKFRIAVLVHGKDRSFDQRYKKDKKEPASKSSPSEFSQLYASKKTDDSGKCGWDDVFEKNLTMYCGIGIDPDGNNDCLARSEGGTFI